MSALALAALIAILAHQPVLYTETIPAAGVTEYTLSTGRIIRSDAPVYGWTECRDTGEVARIATTGNDGVTLHELLHGADCIDNGKMDGSLLPYAPKSTDPAHEWVGFCFANQAQCQRIIEAIR